MSLIIIGRTVDIRTQSHVIYGQIEVGEYLNIVGNNYDEYGIQRKKEKHKAYQRMKTDIIDGALLPPITLAVNQNSVLDVLKANEEDNDDELIKLLSKQGSFSILDGLQRTYILNEIKDEGVTFKEGQKLLLEFWVDLNIKHLIYRLIVLNAGQKPMSMRHQIELLFMSTAALIESRIPNIELLSERSGRRRIKPKQYPFERIVSGYQSFLWKSPDLNKDNIVAQQLLEESILDSSEEALNQSFEVFFYYLDHFTKLDELIYNRYIDENNDRANWIANENVMNSFFASIADFGSEDLKRSRINESLAKLELLLQDKSIVDPLGLDVYEKLLTGFVTRKVNVGVATRRLTTNGFKEFFREAGEKKFDACWILGS